MNRADQQYAIGRGIAAIRGTTSVDTDYISFAIRHSLPGLLAMASGSVFPNLSSSDIKSHEIAWPDSAVRANVVAVLAALDDKIDLNRRTNQTIDYLSVSAYERAITRQCQWKEMADVCDIIRITVDPARQPASTFSLYSFEAFDDGRLPQVVDGASIKSQKLVVPEGTVLVAKLNPHIPRVWVVDPQGAAPAIASTEWLVLRPKAGSGPALLYAVCRSKRFQLDLTSRVTGSTGSHQRVAAESMMRIPVRWPTPDAEAELYNLLNPMFDLARHNGHESRTLAELLDALLPELISGRMTVN
jgi:type I restriction enzyme S subunit